MADHERSITVAAAPDAAFRLLADPGNLPRYVATMVEARPEGHDELHVAAEVQGRHEEGEARFQVDEAARRLSWGGRDESGYGGWLQVAGSNGGAAVTVHIHSERSDEEGEITRALDETMANIRRLVETG